MLKTSNQILVNYNRCLGVGTWANVYSGKDEKSVLQNKIQENFLMINSQFLV